MSLYKHGHGSYDPLDEDNQKTIHMAWHYPGLYTLCLFTKVEQSYESDDDDGDLSFTQGERSRKSLSAFLFH